MVQFAISIKSMKKLILSGLVLTALFAVPSVHAAEVVTTTTEEIICPQPYGGGVVCGVKTHKVVETGIADNLPLIGSGLVGASALFTYVSRKLRKIV